MRSTRPVTAPALDPRLASARAKWERAKTHADTLIADMKAACDGGVPHVSRTSRRYDAESECVVWVAEEIVPEISDEWSLMIGEYIYNLRCALDHLWWQLAIDNLGREPRGDEAPDIQFPVLTRTDAAAYDDHRFLKHVSTEAAEKAKSLQGYDAPAGSEMSLTVLHDLSIYDRHRESRPTLVRATGYGIALGDVPCRDCEMPKSKDPDFPDAWEATIDFGESDDIQVGDEVLRQMVVPTGPNPDIDVDPAIRGQIGFGPEGVVLSTLKELGAFVRAVIVQFAPLLRPPRSPRD